MAIGNAAERASQMELACRRIKFSAELGIASLTKGMPGTGLIDNRAIRRAAEYAQVQGFGRDREILEATLVAGSPQRGGFRDRATDIGIRLS